jgi:hypothetical protein
MELKEQIDIAEEAVRRSLIIALEQKEDFKANKLFKILGDVREVMPLRYEPGMVTKFNLTNNPDRVYFGETDSGICLG